MKTKKHLIVLILRILEAWSDKNNPLTQTEIAEMISSSIPCDRKTVGRNIGFLKELGYPIIKTTKGFYMDGMGFTREEITLVTDLVRSSSLPKEKSDDLSERLYGCLTRYYKR